MSKNLILALVALVTVLAFYSHFVMAEKFTFIPAQNAETKTTAIQ